MFCVILCGFAGWQQKRNIKLLLKKWKKCKDKALSQCTIVFSLEFSFTQNTNLHYQKIMPENTVVWDHFAFLLLRAIFLLSISSFKLFVHLIHNLGKEKLSPNKSAKAVCILQVYNAFNSFWLQVIDSFSV